MSYQLTTTSYKILKKKTLEINVVSEELWHSSALKGKYIYLKRLNVFPIQTAKTKEEDRRVRNWDQPHKKKGLSYC